MWTKELEHVMGAEFRRLRNTLMDRVRAAIRCEGRARAQNDEWADALYLTHLFHRLTGIHKMMPGDLVLDHLLIHLESMELPNA